MKSELFKMLFFSKTTRSERKLLQGSCILKLVARCISSPNIHSCHFAISFAFPKELFSLLRYRMLFPFPRF
jgi:hypothetical protein